MGEVRVEQNISNTNSITSSSQQEVQFAVPRFSFVFNTFKPEHQFAFTRTQFTAGTDSTRL